MKKLFTLLFLFSLTTLAISQDHTIETVGTTGFNPTDLTITVGQTVQWVNTGGTHNVNGTTVTYPNNPESFGNAVGAGWTFDHTFMTPGTYNYQCDPHVGLGMVGTVTVMPLPTYTIAQVTGDSDMNGEADSVGVACTLTGVVHGIDMQGGGNVQFTIIDSNNDGIGIFSSNDYGYTVLEGDEVTMDGTVASFNGLAQFNPDTIIVNSTGNALTSVMDVTDLDETTESQVVRLVGVSLVDPTQWDGSGSNNIDVTDGTSTWTVRIDSDVADVNALAPPAGTFNVTGIGGQFDSSDPYTDGYQLLPRYAADVEVITTGCEIGILTSDSDMNGEADSVGVVCTITGVVYGIDMQGGGNVQFTVIDAAGDGIGVFSSNDYGYTVLEGDEVTMDGTVASFNGLAQFNPDTIILNSSGNAIAAPTDVADLDESTESQLIRLTNLTLVDPTQWDNDGSNNIDVTDGTSTWTVRIDSDVADLNALPAPTGAFNITGIGGQFDSSDPYTSGYQLLPRYTADLDLIVAVNSDLIITGVADPQGSNGAGGTAFGPRAIELHAINDIADMSIYGIGSASNGGGTDSIEFSFPAISLTAGDCITLSDSAFVVKFTNFFGSAPTILVDGAVTGVNGNDAIELFKDGEVVDVFGEISGSDPAWFYTDGWAYRKDATGPDGSNFNINNWTFSGVDALQSDVIGDTTNLSFPNPFPLCSYSSMPPTDLTASNDDITVDMNVATNLDVLANDITPNAVTILAVTSAATSGTVTANGTTDFTYTPNMDFCGTDQFMYEVCDASTCDTAIVNITVTCPATSPLIIVGVADPQPSDGAGGNTSGARMIELYVLEDIADLSIYGVGAANNGGGTDGIEYTFPAVSASAGDCITYTDSLNEVNFETFFGFPATFLVPSGGVSAALVNGDDAVELFENGIVVDVFGDPDVDGSGTAWDYQDGWAYRNFGEGPNQGIFDASKWSYSGVDELQDNTNTMNSQYTNPFPTCTYALTPPPPAYPIGLVINDSDGNLVADSVDVVCRLTGVIHGIDFDGNEGYSFTIIDAAGDGINVHSFDDVDGYSVSEGDEVTVQGFILNYNGLDEIRAEKITMNSAGNALFTPTDVSTLDEDSESQFITMTTWTMVTPSQWLGDGSSFNVDITDGTNTYQMRIDSDTEMAGMPIPTGDIFNITGIGGQFDGSGNPILDMGYQIFPRYSSDIEGFVSTINPELGNKIKMYPNPVSDNLQIRMDIQLDNIRITNMLGQQVAELQNPTLSETINVNNWQSGIYIITFISGDEIWTTQFVKN